MKKGMMLAVAVAVLGMALTGCGKQENKTEEVAKEVNAAYLKDFDVNDFVTLGEYKGLEVNAASLEVSQEEKDAWIRNTLLNYATLEAVEDREVVESGDVANIDYVGKKDGTAFEGGTDSGYDLEIGSGSFIPGFEDGIIGMKKGETKDIPLTFPETYHNADMAGAEVVFTVTVNEIKEYKVPELTDDMVASFGIENVATVQDYQTYAETSIQTEREESNEIQILNQILEKLEEGSTIADAPTPMVDRLYESFLAEYTSRASMYGVDVSYMVAAFYGGTQEEYEQTLRELAEGTAKQYMMLAAVADKEGITISGEDVEADIRAQIGEISDEEFETTMAGIDQEEYREYLLMNEICGFLKEQASVTVEE